MCRIFHSLSEKTSRALRRSSAFLLAGILAAGMACPTALAVTDTCGSDTSVCYTAASSDSGSAQTGSASDSTEFLPADATVFVLSAEYAADSSDDLPQDSTVSQDVLPQDDTGLVASSDKIYSDITAESTQSATVLSGLIQEAETTAASESADTAASRNTITTASGEILTWTEALSCTATAYTGGGSTASGTRARVGTVAVDPDVIPLGSLLYIVTSDGYCVYGLCTAEDTGSAISGNRIDLYFETYAECVNFGQRNAVVYILQTP